MTLNIYDIAASRPWLIEKDSLDTILSIAERATIEGVGDPQALATKLGRSLDNARTVTKRDGVAIVPVTGPIFRYANLFTEVSGATSTQVLATDIQTALDDPSIKGIVLDINSPGGEATGINELSQMIYDARGKKPISAYIGGQGSSAAYWIASAAKSITMDATATAGSIGVVMSYNDTTKRDEKSDVQRREIISSQSPDKRIDPNTDAGRAKVQTIVDAMAGVFIGAVARNRGVTKEKAMNDFGRGGVLVGEAAVNAGMADRIGSLESVIAALAGSPSNPVRKNIMAIETQKGAVTVANTDELRLAIAAGYAAEQISIAQIDTKSLYEEGFSAGKSEGINEATKSERERISGIQAIAEPGFEKETDEAISSGASVADTALAMAKARKDRGVDLNSIAKDGRSVAHAATPSDENKVSWAKVLSKFGVK